VTIGFKAVSLFITFLRLSPIVSNSWQGWHDYRLLVNPIGTGQTTEVQTDCLIDLWSIGDILQMSISEEELGAMNVRLKGSTFL
jgi:hypothetical protein